MTGSLLINDPKTFSHWWTFTPVLPGGHSDYHYMTLKRQWADHTMNRLSGKPGAWRLASNRGFYVERREDHIATVLFHIWAAFPDLSWVGPLLDLWGIPHGAVSMARWSYSWEQRQEGKLAITDIVLSWKDEAGEAVLVIEAKRPGGKLADKDTKGGQCYLNMPSIRSFARKHIVYLVDKRDVAAALRVLPPDIPVASWQAMGDLQVDLAGSLNLPGPDRELMRSFTAKHYADLGMGIGHSDRLREEDFTGSHNRYDEIRKRGLPDTVERFLLGSEVTFCARQGRMPEPPFRWLADEPSLVDVVASHTQTTREREKPLWRLPVAA